MTGQGLTEFDEKSLRERYRRRFAAGDQLFAEGEPAAEAFLLEEGRIRLVKRVGAIERGLRVLRPGDLCGEAALIHGVPHHATAIAVEPGAALAFDAPALQRLLVDHPALGSQLIQQLVQRLRDAEDQVEVLMIHDARAKVVVTLLKLAQQALGPGTPTVGASLTVSPMELAARAGLDVDAVKRTVQELRGAGYLAVNDERLEVQDLAALHELAGLLDLEGHIGRPDAALTPTRSR